MVDTKIEGAIKDIQDYITELETKIAKYDLDISKAKEKILFFWSVTRILHRIPLLYSEESVTL